MASSWPSDLTKLLSLRTSIHPSVKSGGWNRCLTYLAALWVMTQAHRGNVPFLGPLFFLLRMDCQEWQIASKYLLRGINSFLGPCYPEGQMLPQRGGGQGSQWSLVFVFWYLVSGESLCTLTPVWIHFFSPGYLCHYAEMECLHTACQTLSLHSSCSPFTANCKVLSKHERKQMFLIFPHRWTCDYFQTTSILLDVTNISDLLFKALAKTKLWNQMHWFYDDNIFLKAE